MEEFNSKLDNFIYDTNNQNTTMNQKLDESLQTFANMQLMLNTLTQIVHSQVNVLNQMSQQVNYLTLKLTDMEISTQNNDSTIGEILDNQRSMMNNIEEVKNGLENVRLATMYRYE